MAKKTQQQFVEEMKSIHPSIRVLGEYKTRGDNILCECTICGTQWSPKPHSLLSGHGCPNFRNHPGNVPSRFKTHDIFIDEMQSKNPSIQIIGEYKGAQEPIKAKCRICGYEWEPLPTNLLKGSGCPKCSGHAQRTHGEFVKEMDEANPNIAILGTFINVNSKVRCKCKICGHEWEAAPKHLLAGHGCPKCVEYLQTFFPETDVQGVQER